MRGTNTSVGPATVRLQVYPSITRQQGKVITLDLRSRLITRVVSSQQFLSTCLERALLAKY